MIFLPFVFAIEAEAAVHADSTAATGASVFFSLLAEQCTGAFGTDNLKIPVNKNIVPQPVPFFKVPEPLAWIPAAFVTKARSGGGKVFAVFYTAGFMVFFVGGSATFAPVLFAEVAQAERTVDAAWGNQYRFWFHGRTILSILKPQPPAASPTQTP